MQFDVLTIGSYALDVILNIPESNQTFNKEKIIADKFNFSIGGNACNVAVGMQRLGFKTSLITQIGSDFTAKFLQDAMKEENVDISLSSQTNDMSANYSTTLFFQNEKNIVVYHPDVNFILPGNLETPKLLFVSSVGENYEQFFNQVTDFVSIRHPVFAFNPASHQLRNDISTYQNVLKVCDYLFVNKREAMTMLKTQNGDDINYLLRGLAEFGSANIILTDGTNGSYLKSGKNISHCPILKWQVVQKTGAGDAFTSGFLSGILQNKTGESALKRGSVNAASVIANWGPQKGLLRKEEMEKIIEEYNLTHVIASVAKQSP